MDKYGFSHFLFRFIISFRKNTEHFGKLVAEARKRERYRGLTDRYRFEPVAIETTGVLGPSTTAFVRELGLRVSAVTGEKRETEWLIQRLALAVVRGNAASVLATGCTVAQY